MSRYVSIPYRLATNISTSLFKIYSFLVSIPYRLATNAKITKISDIVFEFQFLIGWLQTKFLHLVV